MKHRPLLVVASLLMLGASADSRAALAVLGQFDPSNAGSLCGIAFDPADRNVWVYACSGADVQRYATTGTFLSSVTRPGESANDVDVEFAPVPLTLDTTPLAQGTLLFVNGESGVAEIYAVDKSTGAVLETLATAFGGSHVVGGSYHPGRSTFFLVQDNVPGAADENRIAEVNPTTGTVLNSFQTTGTFDVSFGDVEVCSSTGNLLIVSSIETSLAEFTPAGALVQLHPLPAGVSLLSGIGVDDAAGEIWVSGTSGSVWRLSGVCGGATPVPVFPMIQTQGARR